MKATIVVDMDGAAFGVTYEETARETGRLLAAVAGAELTIQGLARNADHGEAPRTIKLYASDGAPCGRLTVSGRRA